MGQQEPEVTLEELDARLRILEKKLADFKVPSPKIVEDEGMEKEEPRIVKIKR